VSQVPPSRFLARAARTAIRALTPFLGEPRAQWVVARTYAVLYLVRFYLRTQYARATLGFVWLGLAPLLLVAVYLPVFLIVFKARLPGHDSPLDYTLYCLIGLLAWSAVSDAIGQSASSLVYNASIVRHAPTPPAMLPIVKVLASFVWLAIGLVLIAVVLQVTGRGSGQRLLLLPVAYLLLLAFMVGLGFLLSMVAAYVHDLLQALPTILAIEFFAAPITYAPTMATGKITFLVHANPLTSFLGLFRAALLPWQPFDPRDAMNAAVWALATLVVGGLVFKSLEGGVRDVV
jgi:ABC-type polysaccharide/polyol phosphate export permease